MKLKKKKKQKKKKKGVHGIIIFEMINDTQV